MMYWYGHGVSNWGWLAMSLSTLFFWALLGAALYALVRALGRDRRSAAAPPASPAQSPERTPEQLLSERFARGEIDEEEYLRRLDVLRDNRPHPR